MKQEEERRRKKNHWQSKVGLKTLEETYTITLVAVDKDTNNKGIKTHLYILFLYCSGKRHNHCKSDSHLFLQSRETSEIWLLRIRAEMGQDGFIEQGHMCIRAEKGQDGFIEQGRMCTDNGSQSESEEFAEPSSAVIWALVKALMTLICTLISTLFLALTKSELTYRNSSTY